jgi:hypothetical protein
MVQQALWHEGLSRAQRARVLAIEDPLNGWSWSSIWRLLGSHFG